MQPIGNPEKDFNNNHKGKTTMKYAILWCRTTTF